MVKYMETRRILGLNGKEDDKNISQWGLSYLYPSLNNIGQQKQVQRDSRDIQLSRDMDNSQERLVEHTDNKTQRGRPSRKWKVSINMHTAQKCLWRAFVNTGKNPELPAWLASPRSPIWSCITSNEERTRSSRSIESLDITDNLNFPTQRVYVAFQPCP